MNTQSSNIVYCYQNLQSHICQNGGNAQTFTQTQMYTFIVLHIYSVIKLAQKVLPQQEKWLNLKMKDIYKYKSVYLARCLGVLPLI